jgi:hypothetical protein
LKFEISDLKSTIVSHYDRSLPQHESGSAHKPADSAEVMGPQQNLLSCVAKINAIAIVEKRAAENRDQNFNRY